MSTPFVRPFNFDTDHSAGLHVFFTTIDPSVSHDPARTIGSYLWYKAYVYLTPSTCFVLDDGSGRAVGYIIGTPDTAAFAKRWRETFTPVVDPKLVPPPGPQANDPEMETELVKGLRREVHHAECSMLQSRPRLLSVYPAHLHINILPEFTGQGWGPKLMSAFLSTITQLGACGVHLGMVATNDGARRFYERLGFEVCGEVLDGGVSGEVGREGGAACLVKRL
ncbi:acyl-CoA N-acyltransferase [Karstenula rhodostoma CBS 690.94]|uniref:Acyl-CoA N-acyltransferase n=1 Tax=Karstenula rhodostoma CBS 690.94 TaxID=1392251 RepID=A0A9P4PN89_9PLEO|nr:acyl-CoA N-acyltransferase [Karstenula rhodostoma CBS 690.94]